jgi:hypothetical protein
MTLSRTQLLNLTGAELRQRLDAGTASTDPDSVSTTQALDQHVYATRGRIALFTVLLREHHGADAARVAHDAANAATDFNSRAFWLLVAERLIESEFYEVTT